MDNEKDLEKGSDPLEIKQEICFENENIDIKFEPVDGCTFLVSNLSTYQPFYLDHTYSMKEEIINIEFKGNSLFEQTENYPPGIERIVDVNDLLKKKDTTLNLDALLPNGEYTSPTLENLENNIKKELLCKNCMDNIEYFCVACQKSWEYHKELTSCYICQLTLKLQCKICRKRFKFLNKVQQCVLQASKKLNLLSREKKQVTFTCQRKQNFVCSKCKYQTAQKEQLIKHIEKFHRLTVYTNLHKKSTATSETVANDLSETIANVTDKSIGSNLISKDNEANLSDTFNIKNFLFNPNSLSNLDNLLKTSFVQSLAEEVAQVKKCKETKNSENPSEINSNQDNDQYIELFCSECKKTCKKVVYDEIIKPVCRECQQLMLYRCTLCASRYKLLKYVRLHIKRVCSRRINGPTFNCMHCDYKAEVKSRLEFHIKSEHTPKNCPKCKIELENVAALKLHLSQCPVVQRNRRRVVSSCSLPQRNESDLDDVPLIIRQKELMLKNYLNEKLPIDDDDSYIIIENDPEKLINEMSKKSSKQGKNHGWRSLIDYYCLKCDGKVKKKFSKFRPRCPKCNIKYDYRCISCEKLYGGYNTIYRHIRYECQSRFEAVCSICDYTSTRKYLLLNHIKSKHAVYKCLRCNVKCEGYLSLRKHQSNDCKIDNPHGTMHVKRLVGLYCKYCYKRSRRPTENNELVPCERCTIIMNYQCLKCNKLFDYQDVTYKHVREECKPTFLCDKCDFKAYIQYDLNVHNKYVHTIRKCQDCGVNFKDEYIFRMHRIEELKRKALGIIELSESKRLKKAED